MEFSQQTLSSKVVFTGKGLHSGRVVRLEVLPAPAHSGIVFRRVDTEQPVSILAHIDNVSSTQLSTTIGQGAHQIGTIEHLMAAFYGMGIDNAIVNVDAPELPILDGSSRMFVNEFLRVGLRRYPVQKRLLIVKKRFEYRDGDKVIKIEPAKSLRFRCAIDFSGSVIGQQSIDFAYSPDSFLTVADARTFCHLREVNAMRQAGLALGGSLENAVVVGDEGVINEEGLRGDNEFVRHKLLDCIGDLALLGAPLVGLVSVTKPGHALHVSFMRELEKVKHQHLTIVEPTADRTRAEENHAHPVMLPSAVFG